MSKQNTWLSASGWDNADWESADWASAEGEENAAGQGASKAPQSQPYIIIIANTTTTAVSNVIIGDAYNAFTLASPSFGNTGISLTSGRAAGTYQQWLGQTMGQPFSVKRIMLISSSGKSPERTFSVTHLNSRGKQESEEFVPLIDPRNQQTDRVIENSQFTFDGYAKITFVSIQASQTLNVYLYPDVEYNPIQIVSGRPAKLGFKKPTLRID